MVKALQSVLESAEWTVGAADNMLQAAYLTIGKLAPDYENVELSVGGSTVAAAVVEATGRSMLGVGGMQLCITFCWQLLTTLHYQASLLLSSLVCKATEDSTACNAHARHH